mgnify:FL=1
MIIGCAYFGTGVSASDAMAGAYLIFAIFSISIIIITDRFCVWKFGSKKVNKIQLYILGGLILLFVINGIRLGFSK